MTEPSDSRVDHLGRYRDRQDLEAVRGTTFYFVLCSWVAALGLALAAVIDEEGIGRLGTGAAALAMFLLGFGLWRAKEWARRVTAVFVGVLFVAALGQGIRLGLDEGLRAALSKLWMTAFLGALMAALSGDEARRSFDRARVHLERKS